MDHVATVPVDPTAARRLIISRGTSPGPITFCDRHLRLPVSERADKILLLLRAGAPVV
jgi:hypothetical protein